MLRLLGLDRRSFSMDLLWVSGLRLGSHFGLDHLDCEFSLVCMDDGMPNRVFDYVDLFGGVLVQLPFEDL